MITTKIIPLATADSQELLVEAVEKVCRTYCVNGVMPSASIAFTLGTTKVLGGNAITPVTATVTVVTPSCNGCGCAHTQVFTETFDVAFNETGSNVVTIVPGTATVVEPAGVTCCKAHSVKVTTSLTVSIA